MRSLFCVFILFSYIYLVQSQHVTELTDLSWDDTISGIWMVKFYAPWCGHCKKYAPVFEETALITSESNGYINFGEIDCDSNKITCSDYHITGYPTTLLLYNGKLIANYKQSRDSAVKIKTWIITNLNPTHLRDADILSSDEIQQIINIRSKPYGNKKIDNTNTKRNKNIKGDALKIFPWEFSGMNDFYSYLLGDTHPTVPFVIYLIGTLSGIILGVSFVLCAAN
eukprot:501525_1